MPIVDYAAPAPVSQFQPLADSELAPLLALSPEEQSTKAAQFEILTKDVSRVRTLFSQLANDADRTARWIFESDGKTVKNDDGKDVPTPTSKTKVTLRVVPKHAQRRGKETSETQAEATEK